MSSQRRLASEILKVGESRIWMDPERMEEIESSITREEIKRLIHEGAIRKIPERGTSRARVRVRRVSRRGIGSRKGSMKARLGPKSSWPLKIRSQRRFLRELKERRLITTSSYRRLYLMAKGGTFKSLAELRHYIEVQGLARRGLR